MKLDTSKVLLDYENNEIQNANQEADGKITIIPLTIINALVTAINTPAQLKNTDGTPMFNSMGQPIVELFTSEQKGRSYQLSTKLYSNKEVHFTEDEVVYIKQRIEKIWNSPVIQGELFKLLSINHSF